MRNSTSLLSATTLVAGMMAAYLWHQLDAERDRNAELQARVSELESQPPVVIPASTAPPQAAVQSPPEESEPTAGPAAERPGASSPPVAIEQTLAANVVSRLTQDPEFCALQKSRLRMQIPRSFPDVDTELGLSPAEYEALMDLMVRQQEDSPGNPGRSGGNTPVSPESLAALQQSQQIELERLLGARYPAWQEYQVTVEGRRSVNSLRASMSTSGTPLTDDQFNRLTATIVAETKRRKAETDALGTVPNGDQRARLDMEEKTLKILEDSYARTQASSQRYLAPEQWAQMQNSQEQYLMTRKNALRAMRMQLESGANNGQQGLAIILPPQ
jgi:hypothetical protein